MKSEKAKVKNKSEKQKISPASVFLVTACPEL